MPSPQFIPFDPQRFAVRSNGSDTHDGNGQGGESESGERRSVRCQPPHHPPVASSSHEPETVLQAVMEAKPHDEPAESIEERQERGDFLALAIEKALTERQRYIVEWHFYGGDSVRELGRKLSLSKSQVHRIKDEALLLLRHWMVVNEPSLFVNQPLQSLNLNGDS